MESCCHHSGGNCRGSVVPDCCACTHDCVHIKRIAVHLREATRDGERVAQQPDQRLDRHLERLRVAAPRVAEVGKHPGVLLRRGPIANVVATPVKGLRCRLGYIAQLFWIRGLSPVSTASEDGAALGTAGGAVT